MTLENSEALETSHKNVLEFSQRYLNLLNSKKQVDLDIKALKDEFDEEGVPTKNIVKAINNIKRSRKISSSVQDEIDLFETWLNEDANISNTISDLISK